MTLSLDRLIWRYEYGYAAEDVVRAAFDQQAALLREDFAALSGRLDIIRQWDPSLIFQFDEAHAAYYKAMAAEPLRDALRCFARAREILTRCCELLDSADLLDRARDLSAGLQSLARESSLATLPSFATPAQLVEDAEAHMRRGEYLRAASIARVSIRYTEPMVAADDRGAGADADGVSSRLDALARTYEKTVQFVSEASATRDQEAVQALVRLSASRRALAQRALGELEWSESQRARFARTAQHLSAQEVEPIGRELRELDARSWSTAADRLLGRMVLSSASALEQQFRDLQIAIGVRDVEPHS